MLADGLVFTYEEKVDTAYGVIVYNASKVGEQLHSQIRVIEKLH